MGNNKLKIVGLIALLLGIALYFAVPDNSQKNLEIARTVTSAQEAAKAISANNQAEVGLHIASMALIGFGGVVTVFSFIVKKK